MTHPDREIEALAVPIAYAGCYSLHLYCDHDNPAHGWDEFPHEYDEFERGSQARSKARADGWIIHRDRTATCPKCAAHIRSNHG